LATEKLESVFMGRNILALGFALGVLSSQAQPVILNAQANFTLTGNYIMGSNAVTLAVEDVNADGRQDLIVANGTNGVVIFTNNGCGSFGSNAIVATSAFALGSITVADVNGDGFPDIVGTDGAFATGHVTVCTNSNAGIFYLSGSYVAGSVPGSLLVADINNDGKPDIICGNQAAKTLSVLTNDGSGMFATASTPATGLDGLPCYILAADLKNNGVQALICANNGYPLRGKTLSVLTNGDNGVFKLASTPAVGQGPGNLTPKDVNGDGKVDLICFNNYDKSMTVLTNDGGGGLATAATLALGFSPSACVGSDLNGDGKIDFVCANFAANALVFLTNGGSLQWASNSSVVVSRPYGTAVLDLNGDGQKDLLCINDGRHPINVYTSPSSISVLTQVPNLISRFLGNSLILSWSSAFTNWTLVESTNLTRGWVTSPSAVSNDGTNKTATNTLTAGAAFFRLSLP
jgi:hypothetical protein